jgi:hypothetical protein
MFAMCSYAATIAYEGRKDINDIKKQLGSKDHEPLPPLIFPPSSNSNEKQEESALAVMPSFKNKIESKTICVPKMSNHTYRSKLQ